MVAEKEWRTLPIHELVNGRIKPTMIPTINAADEKLLWNQTDD